MNSTAAKQLENSVFYLDESIYSRVLADRIGRSGATVQRPGQALPFGTHDEVWLAQCGSLGWIVLMRDQRVRRRPLELAALAQARVGAFLLTAGQATATETADTIERLLPKFARLFVNQPRPFLYTFGLRGSLTRVRVRA